MRAARHRDGSIRAPRLISRDHIVFDAPAADTSMCVDVLPSKEAWRPLAAIDRARAVAVRG
jgi:hypothetical protein